MSHLEWLGEPSSIANQQAASEQEEASIDGRVNQSDSNSASIAMRAMNRREQLLSRPLVRSPAKKVVATRWMSRRARRIWPSSTLHDIQLFICLLFLLSGADAMMCGVPGRSENDSRVSLYSAAVYNPGQKTEYSCEPGLALLGDSIRTCQNDGSWSGSRPRCVANLAHKKPVASSRVVNHYKPDLIVDGNSASCIYLDTRVDDRFIQIDLGRNYLISGIVIHVPDGYVQELTVFIAEKLESANGIQYRRCTQGLSRINAPKLQIECRGEDGIPLAVPGRFLHIRDERKIHDFYFALCEIEIYSMPAVNVGCGIPDQPAFATPFNLTQLQDPNRNTFEFNCQTGFNLRGPKVLRCVDGNWIGNEIARCIAVECHPLIPLINGQIDLFPIRGLNNNSYNSVARHRCSDGYMIFGGDITRTCGQDGRWSGTPPFCRPTDCQLPRPVSNAVYKLVDNHTRPGAIAQYTCFNGFVPQRILADKPLQTAIVCQRSGVWKEGNFYCALRTTYYPPVSISFSTTTDKSSEVEQETMSPGTTVMDTTPEPSRAPIPEIEFVQSGITSFELEGTEDSSAISIITSTSASVSSTEASDSNRSTGTAIAATGFVAAFILILMVIVGVALNLCRMRTAFDRMKKRLLLASSNLLINNSSNKEGVCNNSDNRMGTEDQRSSRRQVTVKIESEPVYNDLDGSYVGQPDFYVTSSTSGPSSEEESTYLDIDIGKNTNGLRDHSFRYCSDKSSLPTDDSYQNESSFIESTRPSLTPDEILLLYAKVDKTKKTRNRALANDYGMQAESILYGEETARGLPRYNGGLDRFVHQVDSNHLEKSTSSSKIRDFHPRKVNDLQLPKAVVEVTLNEFFVEHSRIRCQEKNTTYILESRPLPALPSAPQQNETTPERDEEMDSQHIYATLPMNKS